MEKQYKLYKLDKNEIDSTIDKLDKVIGKEKYKKINNFNVAIEYNYLENGYRELLEVMSELKASQYIVTTNKFYNILKNFISKGMTLYEIKLNSLLKEENDLLYQYICKINSEKDKNKFLDLLLDDLKWYNYDEGIDISSMSFGINVEDSQRKLRFHIYNNGIVAIDSILIEDMVLESLKAIV